MRKQLFVKKSLITAFVLMFILSVSASCLAAKTGSDFVAEAKKTVEEISVDDAKADIDAGKVAFIVDCRTEKEFDRGHLPKAIHVDRGLLEFQANEELPDKDAYIICYCKTGGRSCLATNTLTEMGYTSVKSMAGGWKAWIKAGYPIEE